MATYMAETKNCIFYAPVGSMNGLKLLKRKAANVSCVHILDVDRKEYNLSYVSRYLDNDDYSVVTMYSRDQGIYARKTDKSKIMFSDVASKKLSFVNRNQGSGTRLLIDFLLTEEGIAPAEIKGYYTEAQSHLEAGLKVLTGEADVAFGVQYVADVLGLRFIPLLKERFDMVIPQQHEHSEQVKTLLSFFEQKSLLPYIKDFPGYDISQTGQVLTG